MQVIDPQKMSDTKAFSFLLGDSDGSVSNFHITPDGGVVRFDFDQDFAVGILDTSRAVSFPIGRTLPEKYTQKFITSLSSLEPSTIRSRFTDLLTEEEIEFVIYRREMILEDVENKGTQAFF
ncbi:MAG: hypothetical protein HOE90_22100 [Bacteriovoracaceae bacterium]|nr:hypothetical protein [Bacteriovoracaceae bacterium]